MRKDHPYAAGKEAVKDREGDLYAFVTMSLRSGKFEISCCVRYLYGLVIDGELVGISQGIFDSSKVRKKDEKKERYTTMGFTINSLIFFFDE